MSLLTSLRDKTHTTEITVVLLCKGKGADKDSFRPNRDETQWWSRRDALVRCVVAFLLGPSPPRKQPTRQSRKSGISQCKKRLICLFDEDFAKAELTTVDIFPQGKTSRPPPTEHQILSIFKRACQKVGSEIVQDGIKCRITLDPSIVALGRCDSMPDGLQSKRQMLEFLQQNCTMEFLRTQGLNSSPQVILRKTNKEKLKKVWESWQKINNGNQMNGSLKCHPKVASDANPHAARFFQQILSQTTQKDLQGGQQFIAATLHESGVEFPCFQLDEVTSTSESPLHLFLFLGAVRDMTSDENQDLRTVCQSLKVPLLKIRFGIVPEFTSKILTILAWHCANGSVMTQATQRLLDAQEKKNTDLLSPSSHSSTERDISTSLCVLCLVPMSSKDITLSLTARDQLHWSLVRIIVCTLWRSRLVSSSSGGSKNSHSNTLHLVFENDKRILSLTETEFVKTMAEQHQAAPSEYQILSALRQKLDDESITETDPKERSIKKRAKSILKQVQGDDTLPVEALLVLDLNAEEEMVQDFYFREAPSSFDSQAMILLLELQKDKPIDDTNGEPKSAWKKALTAASQKRGIPVRQQSFGTFRCHDFQASSIVILQHLLYQHRIHPIAKQRRKRDLDSTFPSQIGMKRRSPSVNVANRKEK